MPEGNAGQTGGASTNQGGSAGSERIELTPKELQSKIDAAVTAALNTREKKLNEQHAQEVAALKEQIEALKEAQEKGTKTQEEQLRDAEKKVAALTEQLKELKQESKAYAGKFGELLTEELGALGESGKSEFEKICPNGLSDADKLVFLAKVKPLLVEKGQSQDEEPGGGDEDETNPAKGRPPITSHEGTPNTGDIGFGKQMAEQKRAEENTASEEGFDPWGQ